MTGAAVDVRRVDGAIHLDGSGDPDAAAVAPADRACSCASCLAGGICFERHGAVVPYEGAVRAADQRLRVLAEILAYIAATLSMPRAVVVAVHPDGQVGTILAWRPPADADARRAVYIDTYADTDLFAPARFMDSTRSVVTVDDVGGPEHFHRTAYGAFLAAAGMEPVGAMYLRHRGRIVACVGLLRELAAPQLIADELTAARRLHPLIETAYACSLEPPIVPTKEDLFDRARLTARERDVVRVAALGARNAEIASALYISVATVKIHLHHAFAKLGVHSRSELAARLQPADD
jgi:DNA-binding CsgD family transcriptional regulator